MQIRDNKFGKDIIKEDVDDDLSLSDDTLNGLEDVSSTASNPSRAFDLQELEKMKVLKPLRKVVNILHLTVEGVWL